MVDECTCGQTFRTAEDYRDHLPCDGSRPVFEIKTMYMGGVSDGYTHHHGPPLYRNAAAAYAASVAEHGPYAVDPLPVSVIELSDGRVFEIVGPHQTAEAAEELKALRRHAWNKLTKAEREALGLKEEPK